MPIPTAPDISIPSVPKSLPALIFQPVTRLHTKMYGAKCDGQTRADVSISSSNKTITSATGFNGYVAGRLVPVTVGMWVTIRFGGTMGANGFRLDFVSRVASVVDANTITLQDQPAVTSASNLVTYGTDDTDAIRNCMVDAIAYGLDMHSNPGQHILAGDLITDDGSGGNPNAILPVYPVPGADALKRRSLTWYGTGIPHTQQLWLAIDTPRVHQVGTWLVPLKGGSGTNPCVIGCTPAASTVQLNLNQIQLAVRCNPSGTGSTMSGVLGGSFAAVNYTDCLCVGDSSLSLMPEPSSVSVSGFTCVDQNRDFNNTMRNTQTWGMGTGLTVGEHMVMEGQCGAMGCLIGLGARQLQSCYVNRINLHWNKWHIGASGGNSFLIVQEANFEERNHGQYTQSWFETQYHVNDSNLIVGQITGHMSYSEPFGTASDNFQIHGGSNLVFKNIKGTVITARV